jgi:hypothetical protein
MVEALKGAGGQRTGVDEECFLAEFAEGHDRLAGEPSAARDC